MADKRLGILVGGGPAPGINAVIGAATIQAVNQGFDVVGFYDGFQHLLSDGFSPLEHSETLDIRRVSRIHFEGGSILRTSRANLLDKNKLKTSTVVEADPAKVGQVLANLDRMGVTHLLTIGGDDTALSARFVCAGADNRIRVVHVPKTIDNDLPLPADVPTFGFSTARYLGTQIVKNLMRDAQTTNRWYFVDCMGRTAGWLSMAIGMCAGATITLIPEEFADYSQIRNIVDVLEGAILKRRISGRPDGVALIAEGLAYKLGDRKELERILGREVPVDAAGHPRLKDVLLVNVLQREIERRFAERGDDVSIVTLDLGYELRCADPTPYDMGYCRSLGFFSIHLLQQHNVGGRCSVMVNIVNGNLHPIDLYDMIDPATNRTRVRQVDLNSDVYRVARAYMIRLEQADLASPEIIGRLAAEARLSPEAFREQYARAATRQPPQLAVPDDLKA